MSNNNLFLTMTMRGIGAVLIICSYLFNQKLFIDTFFSCSRSFGSAEISITNDKRYILIDGV